MANIKKDGNSMGLPMNISRGNPIPIDSTEVWYSLEDARNYAKSGATAYVGQTIKVIDDSTNIAKVYLIKNKAGDLEEIIAGSQVEWETI